MKSFFQHILFAAVFCFGTSSCADYLDIVPDNTGTVEHAFKTRALAEGYLYGCFSFLPFWGYIAPGLLGGDDMWYIRPIRTYDSYAWHIAIGEQGTNAPLCDYWGSAQSSYFEGTKPEGDYYYLNGGKPLFTALNDCNIFLEQMETNKPFDLTEPERLRWMSEVKFLKAFYHYWLYRMYGPIPLIKTNLPVSAKGDEAQRYREPVDVVADYIAELIDDAVTHLPATIIDPGREMGRPTQAIALAIKAQALTWAASPLFNCNEDYADVVDGRGVYLFPQDKSVENAKWERARDALKDAITAAETAGHQLYDFKIANPTYANLDPATVNANQVRGAATDKWNTEIVWADPLQYIDAVERLCFPRIFELQQGWSMMSCMAPTLQAVEQFYTKNGIPVEDDRDWEGVDPYSLQMSREADKLYMQPNFNTLRLHFDREPRFYGSVFFDGGRFYGNGRLTDNPLLYVTFKAGTPGAGMHDSHSSTGYLCKKLINFRTSAPDNGGGEVSSTEYPFPVIRLADLYLMYAETLNECSGSTPHPDVYVYVDKVRKRSGLDGVVESWRDHAISAQREKPLAKTGMREIIRRERMNELAFEGPRFWDLRRWKLSEEYMNKPVRGMNIQGKTAETFYQVTEIFQPRFEKKDYLWPIRQSVLLKNDNLLQNPGWN